MNKVLLICREMTIVHAPCLVQGINGEKVGVSKFSPKHSCHILELTPEAYEKNAKALMQACHIALRRWEPHFVLEEVPENVREFWDGYNAGMDRQFVESATDIFWQGYSSVGGHDVLFGQPEQPESPSDLAEKFLSMPAAQQENAIRMLGATTAEDIIGKEGLRPIYGMQTMEALASTPMRGDLMGAPDTFPAATIAECGQKLREMAGLDGIHLPPVTAETKYWSLMKIAKMEGADISKCKTNAERAKAINENRCQPR